LVLPSPLEGTENVPGRSAASLEFDWRFARPPIGARALTVAGDLPELAQIFVDSGTVPAEESLPGNVTLEDVAVHLVPAAQGLAPGVFVVPIRPLESGRTYELHVRAGPHGVRGRYDAACSDDLDTRVSYRVRTYDTPGLRFEVRSGAGGLVQAQFDDLLLMYDSALVDEARPGEAWPIRPGGGVHLEPGRRCLHVEAKRADESVVRSETRCVDILP